MRAHERRVSVAAHGPNRARGGACPDSKNFSRCDSAWRSTLRLFLQPQRIAFCCDATAPHDRLSTIHRSRRQQQRGVRAHPLPAPAHRRQPASTRDKRRTTRPNGQRGTTCRICQYGRGAPPIARPPPGARLVARSSARIRPRHDPCAAHHAARGRDAGDKTRGAAVDVTDAGATREGVASSADRRTAAPRQKHQRRATHLSDADTTRARVHHGARAHATTWSAHVPMRARSTTVTAMAA